MAVQKFYNISKFCINNVIKFSKELFIAVIVGLVSIHVLSYLDNYKSDDEKNKVNKTIISNIDHEPVILEEFAQSILENQNDGIYITHYYEGNNTSLNIVYSLNDEIFILKREYGVYTVIATKIVAADYKYVPGLADYGEYIYSEDIDRDGVSEIIAVQSGGGSGYSYCSYDISDFSKLYTAKAEFDSFGQRVTFNLDAESNQLIKKWFVEKMYDEDFFIYKNIKFPSVFPYEFFVKKWNMYNKFCTDCSTSEYDFNIFYFYDLKKYTIAGTYIEIIDNGYTWKSLFKSDVVGVNNKGQYFIIYGGNHCGSSIEIFSVNNYLLIGVIIGGRLLALDKNKLTYKFFDIDKIKCTNFSKNCEDAFSCNESHVFINSFRKINEKIYINIGEDVFGERDIKSGEYEIIFQ